MGNYANKRHKKEEKSNTINIHAAQLEDQLIYYMATALENLSQPATMSVTG